MPALARLYVWQTEITTDSLMELRHRRPDLIVQSDVGATYLEERKERGDSGGRAPTIGALSAAVPRSANPSRLGMLLIDICVSSADTRRLFWSSERPLSCLRKKSDAEAKVCVDSGPPIADLCYRQRAAE
jgi:hypothetical protein